MWSILKTVLTRNVRHGTARNQRPSPILYLMTFPLHIILVPVLILLALYKQFVRLLLIRRYGKKFGGLLEGMDMIWTVQEKNWRSILCLVTLVEADTKIDLMSKLKANVKKHIFDTNDYPKLKSTLHQHLGYMCMLRDTYTVDDCSSLLDIPEDKPFDENVLKSVVSGICNEPLPKNGTAMWEAKVSPIPLSEKRQGRYIYPLILRYSHAVGDGATYISLTIKTLGDGAGTSYLTDILAKQYDKSQASSGVWSALLKNAIQNITDLIHVLIVSIGISLFWHYIRDPDRHALHGSTLIGDKVTAWTAEETPESLNIIKRIRNRLPKGKFSDVLYAALSASFTDYYKRNGCEIPKHITLGVPFIVSLRHLLASGPTPLVNNFTMISLELPTVKTSLTETLLQTIDQSESMRSFPDIKVNLLMSRYISGLLPTPVVKKIWSIPGVTASVSNVPSYNGLKICQQNLHQVIFFPQHREKIGVSVGITTFDDKISVGLMADKALISNIQEAQQITDGVFEYIRQLDLETSCIYQK